MNTNLSSAVGTTGDSSPPSLNTSLVELPREARRLNLDKAFQKLSEFVAGVIKTEKPAGLVLGLTGTDSGLAFCVCAEGAKLAGLDKSKVVGIHYGTEYPYTNWFEQRGTVLVRPELTERSLEHDIARWAQLQTYAYENHFILVGTRNRTEHALGTYSTASRVAGLHPIEPLWKSEVFAMCEHLALPKQLIFDSQYMADPACGKCKIGNFANEVDMLIMIEKGLLHPDAAVDVPDLIKDRFPTMKRDYKARIPYTPGADVLNEALIL